MADLDLRSLKRRWHETGALDDEAAYLIALARSGELEGLAFAAWLGNAAAAARCDVEVPTDLGAWAKGFGRWGVSAVLRGYLALSELAATVWEAHFPNEDLHRRAIDALTSHLEAPSRDRMRTAEQCGDAFEARIKRALEEAQVLAWRGASARAEERWCEVYQAALDEGAEEARAEHRARVAVLKVSAEFPSETRSVGRRARDDRREELSPAASAGGVLRAACSVLRGVQPQTHFGDPEVERKAQAEAVASSLASSVRLLGQHLEAERVRSGVAGGVRALLSIGS